METKTLRRCVLCKNRYSFKTTKFFKVPLCDMKRQRWIESSRVSLRKQDLICQYHFRVEDYVNGPRCSSARTKLQSSAVPKMTEKAPELMELQSSHKSCTTQTIDDFLQHSFRVEIMLIREKYEQLEKEHFKLREDSLTLHSSLNKIFSKGQLDKLKNPNKKIMWSSEDIMNAKDLLKCGIRAYKYIYCKGFPLPHIMTLRKWARDKRIEIEEAASEKLAADAVNSASNAVKVRKLPVLLRNETSKDTPFQSNLIDKMQVDSSFTSINNVAIGGDMPDLSLHDIVNQEDACRSATYCSTTDTTSQGDRQRLEKVSPLAFKQKNAVLNASSLTNPLQYEKAPILTADKIKIHQDAMTSLSNLPKHIKVCILRGDGKKEQQKAMLPLSTLPKLSEYQNPINFKTSQESNPHNLEKLPVLSHYYTKEQKNESSLSKPSNLEKKRTLPVESNKEQESASLLSNLAYSKQEPISSINETKIQETASKDKTPPNISLAKQQDKVSILYIDVPMKRGIRPTPVILPRNLTREIKVCDPHEDDYKKKEQNASSPSNSPGLEEMYIFSAESKEVQHKPALISNASKKDSILSIDETKVKQTTSKDTNLLNISPMQEKESIFYIDVSKKPRTIRTEATSPRNVMSEIKVSDPLEKVYKGEEQNASSLSNPPSLEKRTTFSAENKEKQLSSTSLSNFSNSPSKKENNLSNDEVVVQQIIRKDTTLLNIAPKQDKVSILYLDIPKRQETTSKAAISPRNVMREIKVSVPLDDMQDAYEFNLFNF